MNFPKGRIQRNVEGEKGRAGFLYSLTSEAAVSGFSLAREEEMTVVRGKKI